MDLSWCIICDRHCTEDNLYCSDACRNKDIKTSSFLPTANESNIATPPASPVLDPLSYATAPRRNKRDSWTLLATPPNSPPYCYLDT
ncbi:hypothetical protein VTP01DRAFT_3376 [Rhizomucor pusillus]|uniref:uncharacterized protein n=1 Tax=Rhizomucor pusillus TaxID=4840 RepID=UPI003742217A